MYWTKCSRASRRKNSGRDLFPPFFCFSTTFSWFMKDVKAARIKIAEITPAGITTTMARDGQELSI